MQQLIASYLFQNKSCPLPGLGTLSVLISGTEADFTNRVIAAPKPFIQFVNVETDASGLLDYITASFRSSKHEVSALLDSFCGDLKKKMADGTGVQLQSIGNLFTDGSGKINFKQEELPAVYLQPVTAERVIHPEAEHHILVGDKETTNTVMTELLTPKTEIKDPWLIAAIILGVLGLLILVMYITMFDGSSPFGNAIKI